MAIILIPVLRTQKFTIIDLNNMDLKLRCHTRHCLAFGSTVHPLVSEINKNVFEDQPNDYIKLYQNGKKSLYSKDRLKVNLPVSTTICKMVYFQLVFSSK